MRRPDRRHSAGRRGGRAHRQGGRGAARRLEPLSRDGLNVARLTQVETAPGLVFDVLADGPADAPLVLFLHGFAESLHTWEAQIAAVAAAGYCALAPSQRGYSPGARPDPRDPNNYHFHLLVEDAMAIVAACGRGHARFHLVG